MEIEVRAATTRHVVTLGQVLWWTRREGDESRGEAEEKSVTGDARIIRADARARGSLAT
jgi:hypothetical protein